jgi:hypothetical protein
VEENKYSSTRNFNAASSFIPRTSPASADKHEGAEMSTTYPQSGAETPQNGADPADTGQSPPTATDLKESLAAGAQSVRQEAAHFAEKAQGKAAEKVEGAQAAASQTLSDFATAVRKAGDELAQADQSMAGRAVQQAASGLEQVSRTLADKSPGEMLDTVREFGRTNPVAFIGGALLLGIALGRFARSSAPTGEAAATPAASSSNASGQWSDTAEFTPPIPGAPTPGL